MSFFNKLGKVIDIITEPESVSKGYDFESYIASLFPQERFSIVEWTNDICRKHDRYVESDTRPDLTVRHLKTDQIFHIECKYRSELYEGKLNWTNPRQLQRYQEFSRNSQNPFYVVIGLCGKASNPKYLFCIPLQEARYPALYPSIFERYERDAWKEFDVKGRWLV